MHNIDPVFCHVPDVSKDALAGSPPSMSQGVTAAAADYTGAGANNVLVFTADSADGSMIFRIRAKALGTNVASVARVFINNGSTNGTAANNAFYGEFSLPATTASATGATVDIDYPMNLPLPPGFRVYVGLGTAVAAGWVFIGIGGKF